MLPYRVAAWDTVHADIRVAPGIKRYKTPQKEVGDLREVSQNYAPKERHKTKGEHSAASAH